MRRAEPTLVFACDQLEAPPRLGFHLHLLALAQAAAGHVPVRVFCWGDPAGGHPDHVAALDPGPAPAGALARKRHYAARVIEWLDAHAAPGSVLWVRGYSTALLLAPRLRLAADRGVRTVYDAASFLRLEMRAGTNPFLGAVRGFIEEQLWPHFDFVRTLSDPMGDYLLRRGVRRDKVLVIPVGSERRRERWRPHAEPTRLLYVGSGADWQGLPQLIEAMRLVAGRDPRLSLSVAGLARDQAADGDLPANVSFLGRVPHSELAALYLSHDLFVLPRPRTPLTELVVPMKIPEAMSFAMPILGTDLGALRWMVGADGAFLVPDNLPATLAGGIHEALADGRRLAARGERAGERWERFSWERIGEETARLLFGPRREG